MKITVTVTVTITVTITVIATITKLTCVLNATKFFFKNKNVSKKLKLRQKNTIIDKTLTCASEN
jgi:hypothetical protein